MSCELNNAALHKGFFALVSLILAHGVCGQMQLGQLNIDPSKVGVSGISSGAAMATQFHFAHSSEVMGAGIFAGVPYMCGFGGVGAADTCMKNPWLVNVPWLIAEANSVEAAGNIDATHNIEGSKVYIFHGSVDSTVRPGSGPNVQEMYQHYGADIFAEFGIESEHGQPTENYGAPCDSPSADFDYINNCGYNGAFEMLNYLHGGNLSRPDESTQPNGDFQIFDQSEFFIANPVLASMDTEGYIYIPTGCKNGDLCSLQIVFHGCVQSKSDSGDIFATKTQHLEVAELNNIVLLFPQVVPTIENPFSCWDWWAYLLNPLFPTTRGDQIQPVYRMMQRLINGESQDDAINKQQKVFSKS